MLSRFFRRIPSLALDARLCGRRSCAQGQYDGFTPAWFGRNSGDTGDPDPGAQQQFSEFLDQDHPRSSLEDGDQIIVNAGQVLENIAMTMERVDVGNDTLVSIDGMVSTDELMVLVGTLHLGPALAVHVVDTALKIMSARCPAELVGRP